jgi:HSP20 family protein
MEIYEANNETVVTAELPGMNPDDINITATGNQLVISGEKRDENEERRGNFFRSERRYGMFRRVLELPYEINPDDVKVEFDNGLLKLRIPQSAAQQPRRIPVKAGAGQNSGRQNQIGGSASSGSAAQQVGGRFQNRSDGAGSSAGSSQGRLGEPSRPSQGGPSNQRT